MILTALTGVDIAIIVLGMLGALAQGMLLGWLIGHSDGGER